MSLVHDTKKFQYSHLGWVIGVTAIVAFAYLVSIWIEAPAGVVLGLLGLSFMAMAWMAIRILKDPYTTDKTFDQQFYADRDDIRRNGAE